MLGFTRLMLVLPVFIGIYFVAGVVSESSEECTFGHTKCASNNQCIPLSWKCDGDADCDDGSDEIGCPAKTCADTEFPCYENGTCVPIRWKCDGEPDCPNGEDEKNCKDHSCPDNQFSCGTSCISPNWVCDGLEDCENGDDEKSCNKTCDNGMFTCNDGSCISNSWFCDGDKDCVDGSDETDPKCTDKTCKEGEFRCADSTRCIDMKWMCDGDFDCQDHSDENPDNCTVTGATINVCSPGEFQCKTDGECIHESWHCDGDPDCTDGSDEDNCPECDADHFQCANKVCIPAESRCDHNVDCIDGSDETDCPYHRNCSETSEFDCYGDGTTCIAMSRLCDGHPDCQHQEDEATDLCKKSDPCIDFACGLHSHCVKKAEGFNFVADCQCDSGFEMDEGHCKDIDECKEPGRCSQICINRPGGYKCECMEGYVLEKHHLCRAEGEPAWLYYSNRRDIRRLRADTSFMEIVVEDTGNSVGIDMDIAEGKIFWTDRRDLTINSASIKESGLATDTKTVIQNEVEDDFSSDGIAVDWLYKKIYWTENTRDKIMVANYDGQKSKTFIQGGLDDPRAIVADPENGYIYWTDWGNRAKIEKCSMDGKNRTVLLEGDEELGWPNGLAIDYVDQRLYWIDAKLHKIGSMDLNGGDVRYVYEDAREIQRPFAIAVFEDSLYWTDWSTNAIKSVDKWTRFNPATLNIGAYSVMDIKVYHPKRQSLSQAAKAKQLCTVKNCEFMCVPKQRFSKNDSVSVTCICGDNMVLNADGRTCKPSSVPMTTKAPATVKPTPKPTAKPETPKPAATTEKPAGSTGKAGGYTVVPGDNSTKTQGADGGNDKQVATGNITIITGAIASVVIIGIFVAIFLFVRQYKLRNKKSMNFDNPVYRKTTTSEDHCIINDSEPMEALVSNEYHDDRNV